MGIQFAFVNCFAIPNRRLLSKQVLIGLRPPFDLIAKQRGFCEASPPKAGASEQSSRPEKSLSFDWSQLLNAARTFFEQNPDWLPRFARQEPNARAGKKEGGWGKEFLPALAFRRRRISYFALRNAPQENLTENL